jgi:TIR domain
MAGRKSIFISYSHADADTAYVEGLAAALRRRGYSPWVDRYDLKAQENWKDAVDQAMREAQAAVFLIDGSVPIPDRYQEYEWRAAIGASSDGVERPMVPLLLHGAKRPGFLGDRLAIEVGDQPVWDKIVDQLAPFLENHTVGRDEAGYQAARAEMERRLNDLERFLTAMEQEESQDAGDRRGQRR